MLLLLSEVKLTDILYLTDWQMVIVIVISKLLKRHSKARRRAPAYSRALRSVRSRGYPEIGYQIETRVLPKSVKKLAY